jgi:endonuclease/exonuclease/phosphatase family metal-dependent hydrolase
VKGILFLSFVLFIATGCHSVRQAEVAPQNHFNVLTYNINWGGPGARETAQIIKNSKADIVCLQETTPEWEKFLRSYLGHDYSFMEFRNSAGRMGGGLAFLSRLPAREVAYIPSNTGWFDGWIVQFQTIAGPVQMMNVHLRPPISDKGSWVGGYFTTSRDRVEELKRFYNATMPGVPLIVAGDFNDSPTLRPVRWLESQGLVNSLSQFDRGTPTWQCRYHGIPLSRRMDHILYSRELHCSSASVIRAGESDQFPVTAAYSFNSSH